jgi:hypothetical protein
MRFRSGIEGRISVLKRSRRLDRCLNHDESGLERWIGWAIITNNLGVMAAKLNSRRECGETRRLLVDPSLSVQFCRNET